jgi:uncharacterized protein GlcG (DUF336 family)
MLILYLSSLILNQLTDNQHNRKVGVFLRKCAAPKELPMKALFLTLALFASAGSAHATPCEGLPSQKALKDALSQARQASNGGLNLDMWGTIVDRSGIVCSVAFTGGAVDSQWPGSRVISAQKANTANAFSLAGLALSTANLYSAVQPGGSLFGLQESNPVNAALAYRGNVATFGSEKDPMVGKRIGGVNVFGGGLALYNAEGKLLGGLGVSGDTSCADHNIAWRARAALELDYVPAGVSADKNDQIIFDVKDGKSAGGFGHVSCGGQEISVAAQLPGTRKK